MVPRIDHSASNLKEAIAEALTSLDGCGKISEVREYISSKYQKRWKDIGTAMADMCPESKSSTYPPQDRILKRVGRGEYCLREAKPSDKSRTMKTHPKKESSILGECLHSFSFRKAEEILKTKNQLSTIMNAASLTDLSSKADHDKVQGFFHDDGWDIEVSKFPVSMYRLDAFKEGTGVEIERSLIDAIHRSLFRCNWSYAMGQLDLLVFIVPTYKELEFDKVKRDIEEFKEIIPFPVYLVGVSHA